MTDPSKDKHPSVDLPEAVIRAKKSVSIVWVVPFVAILIGGWLGYKALSEKGPTITITFNTAEGLEAGKTQIKYKDVEVGQVESIELSKDLTHVVVTAELVHGAERWLTDKTNFWVVRARVAGGEVSGLGTLFSGAYIGVEPSDAGKKTRKFSGLEVPPVVTADLPGRHFLLMSESLGSLDVGSPVYYRQIKVGQVVAYNLQEDRTAVAVKVFIHAPHHESVYKNTRFWNAGGLDVTLDANGIRVNSESFVTMMIGGISFDTPATLEPGGPAQEGHVFRLYENRRSIYEKTYSHKAPYMLYFSGSVRGLAVGAPVEFRGIKIGEVTDVTLEYSESEKEVRIPVLIALEPERIARTGEKSTVGRGDHMEDFVAKGLRAQLKTGSLITGKLFVDLDFHPEAPPARLVYGGKYPELPTIPRPLEEITTNLTRLVHRLENLPIEEIGKDLRDTVHGTQQLVNSSQLRESLQGLKDTLAQTHQLTANLNKELVLKINASLDQLQKTLAAAESLVGPDAALQYELRRTLEELRHTSQALRNAADYLDRHPEAVIRGKGATQ